MKNLFKALVLCLCLLTAVSFAYAGNGNGKSAKDESGPKNTAAQKGSNYVDENEDGICDNIGDRIGRRGKGYGAGNQAKGKGFRRGLRDEKGPIKRAGVEKPNYVDENEDGICDNLPTKSPSK